MNEPTTERARQYFELGQYTRASDEAKHCLSQDPSNAEAMNLLAMAYCALNEYPQARDSAREAIRLNPQSYMGYYAMARAVVEDTHFEPSARDWGVRWHYLPNRVCARIGLNYIEQALALEPNLATLHGYRGLVLIELGKHEQARASADSGLGIEANNALCLIVNMQALHQLRRPADAQAAAREVLRFDPENTAAHGLLGEIGVTSDRSLATSDHADTLIRHDADNFFSRIHHDFIKVRDRPYIGPPARLLNRLCNLIRSPVSWLTTFAIGVAMLILLKLGQVGGSFPLGLALPIACSLIALLYFMLLGVFTDLFVISLSWTLRHPRYQDRILIWAGHATYAWLYLMVALFFIGLWVKPHVFWGLMLVFCVLDMFRACQAVLGRSNDMIPGDWDLFVIMAVAFVSAPLFWVLMLFSFENIFFPMMAWLILSILMIFLPNMVHGIELVEGRYVTAQEARDHQLKQRARKKQQRAEQRGR